MKIAVTGSTERGLTAYLEALRECAPGLDVVLLLPGQALASAIDGVSGLVVTGGVDIHPREYGEPPDGTEMAHVQPARDAFERLRRQFDAHLTAECGRARRRFGEHSVERVEAGVELA